MKPAHQAPFVLALALFLGLLGDQLIRAPLWGWNVSLGVLAVAGSAAALRYRREPVSHEHRALWPWLAAAFFAAMWAVRDAEVLLGVDLIAALALWSLPLVPVGTLAAAGALETLAAPLRTLSAAATGLPRLAPELHPWTQLAFARTGAGAVGAGLLIGLPVVLVFGALFASADPLFRAAASTVTRIDLGSLFSHAALVGMLTWLIAGYLWASARPAPGPPVPRPQGVLPRATALVPLGAVVLVFTLFLATQASGLFGGEAFIQDRTGLTYAEYARRGFFQLTAASALSLPLVYAAPFVAREVGDATASRSLRSLMALQLAWTALVLLSAMWRMGLYVRAYGLTEDRLYGTAVMLWIGATIVVLSLTALRGRPGRAALGSVVAATALLAALNLVNPLGLIARYNLDHPGSRGADVAHLARLGGDAVPMVVSRLQELDPASRCLLAQDLVRRHETSRGDWRGWTLARVRAGRAVRRIQPFAGTCPAAAPAPR